jgi:hypothetical protein
MNIVLLAVLPTVCKNTSSRHDIKLHKKENWTVPLLKLTSF